MFLCGRVSRLYASEKNEKDCVFDLDVDCRGEWLGFFVEALQKGDEIERKREREGGEKNGP